MLPLLLKKKYLSVKRKHLLLRRAEIRNTRYEQLFLIISMIFELFCLLIKHLCYTVLLK